MGITSAAGRVYAVEGISQSVAVIDAATNTVVVVDTIAVGGGTLTGIAVTPDGSTIFVNQFDTTTIIDTADPSLLQTVTVGARPSGAIASPDNITAYITAYITNEEDASVSVLTTAAQPCTGITYIPTDSFGG